MSLLHFKSLDSLLVGSLLLIPYAFLRVQEVCIKPAS